MAATLEAAFESADVNGDADVEDITWGELAVLTDTIQTAYGGLEPPPELREYHDANLQSIRAFSEGALAHPSEDSFVEDLAALIIELVGVLFEIGFDESKTQEERDRLMEEATNVKINEFFGPEFLAASEAVDTAKAALDKETLALVEASSCYSDSISSGEGQETHNGTAVQEDDHANSRVEATSVEVDSVVEGALDYEGDVDFFVLIAEGGKSYQIQVDVGTLPGHTTTLYDSDGEFLGVSATTNAQSGRPFPRFLEAERPGKYFIEVGGGIDNATGSYTVGVTSQLTQPSEPTPTATPTAAATDGAGSDRAVLVALYNATNGPNWANNDNWLSDAPIGEWYGVVSFDGRVDRLHLPGNQLSGEIPPQLGDLSSLTSLHLVGNRLSGYGNQLSGCVPSTLQDQLDTEAYHLGGLPFC